MARHELRIGHSLEGFHVTFVRTTWRSRFFRHVSETLHVLRLCGCCTPLGFHVPLWPGRYEDEPDLFKHTLGGALWTLANKLLGAEMRWETELLTMPLTPVQASALEPEFAADCARIFHEPELPALTMGLSG